MPNMHRQFDKLAGLLEVIAADLVSDMRSVSGNVRKIDGIAETGLGDTTQYLTDLASLDRSSDDLLSSLLGLRDITDSIMLQMNQLFERFPDIAPVEEDVSEEMADSQLQYEQKSDTHVRSLTEVLGMEGE